MADALGDTAIDSGFTYLDTLADKIYICNAEPTSYADVLTFALGNKAYSPGAVVSSPTNIAGGRQVVTVAVTGGSVTSTGNATKWAVVDSVNSKLLLRGSLTPSRSVVVGDTFNLNAVAVNIMTTTSGSGGGGLDAATTAWIAAVGSSNVSSGRQTLVDNLLVGLKTYNIWPKLDRLWPFAAENTQSALIDVKTLSVATPLNFPSFTTDRGYTGNGSNAYIDTGYNLASSSVNYTRDSACVFAWSNTAGGGAAPLFGLLTAMENLRLYPQFTGDGNTYFAINSSGAGDHISGITDVIGLWSINRDAASGTNCEKLYVNGSNVGGLSVASAPLVNTNLLALAEGGAASAKQICCLGIAASLTPTEQGNLNTLLRTYMTAVGVP
jgi:hypothetical protein